MSALAQSSPWDLPPEMHLTAGKQAALEAAVLRKRILQSRSLALSPTVSVAKVTSRYVVIRSLDGIDAVVPNETLITTTVLNHSYSSREIRLGIPVQISYDSDVEKAMRLMEAAARAFDSAAALAGSRANRPGAASAASVRETSSVRRLTAASASAIRRRKGASSTRFSAAARRTSVRLTREAMVFFCGRTALPLPPRADSTCCW